MTRRNVPIAFAFLASPTLALSTGCFSAVKQAYYEVRGAQAELKLNEPVAYDALRLYKSLQIAPATAALSTRLLPSAVRSAWDRAARRLSTDLTELYPGGPPGLTLETELLYFQEKGLMSEAECLARLRMRSGDRVVVDALVKAESKSFRAGGEDDLTGAAIQAIERFLREQKGAPADAEERRGERRGGMRDKG